MEGAGAGEAGGAPVDSGAPAGGAPAANGNGALGDGAAAQWMNQALDRAARGLMDAATGQPQTQQAQPEGAPEQYGEFQYAEGYFPDEQIQGYLHNNFREMGLSQEQAQRIYDIDADIQAYKAEQWENTTQNEWVNEVRSDPEMGGPRYEETVRDAGRAVEVFGDDEFRALMDESGFGNHPAMVRMFARIGALIGEGRGVRGTHTGPQESAALKMYPTMRS